MVVCFQYSITTGCLFPVQYNDWLEEECDNMAREGLRTLVVAAKSLSADQFEDFERRYNEAKLSIHDRARQVSPLHLNLYSSSRPSWLNGREFCLRNGRPGFDTRGKLHL